MSSFFFFSFSADFQAAADYELTIDLKPTGTYNGWTNVFHFTATGDNCWCVLRSAVRIAQTVVHRAAGLPVLVLVDHDASLLVRLHSPTATMATVSQRCSFMPTRLAVSTGSWGPPMMWTWTRTKLPVTETWATQSSTSRRETRFRRTNGPRAE